MALIFFLFFFNDTATTEIYTLSLHDALPIFPQLTDRLVEGEPAREPYADPVGRDLLEVGGRGGAELLLQIGADRKSTRLNSSHLVISYAVFCLKKKKTYQCTKKYS